MARKFTTLYGLILFGALLSMSGLPGGAKPVHALAGTYIFANGGGYYTRYGPTQYWYTTSGEGFCGHVAGWCSPNNMEYTYSGCTPSNYAKWDNPDSAQWATHAVFVPRVNATAQAPYLLTYNGASGYRFTVNQNAYYDQWVTTTPNDPLWYDIRNTWLDDNPCTGTAKIGFDEIRISY